MRRVSAISSAEELDAAAIVSDQVKNRWARFFPLTKALTGDLLPHRTPLPF